MVFDGRPVGGVATRRWPQITNRTSVSTWECLECHRCVNSHGPIYTSFLVHDLYSYALKKRQPAGNLGTLDP